MVVAREQSSGALAAQRSTYLKYLPAIYSEGDFMGRFLMIFESVMRPIEEMVDNIAHYMDPDTAPEELLPWLASWVNLVLDESWPIERRRRLVKSGNRERTRRRIEAACSW